MPSNHTDDPLVAELVRELQIVARVGAWPAAIASRLDELGFLAALADPAGVLGPYDEPAAIVELLVQTFKRIDPEEEALPVLALKHLLGLTARSMWQLHKYRRAIAADALDKEVSTFRTEYEMQLLWALGWEMVG